jgi:division protein 1
VHALQFDSRKIAVAAGEHGIKVRHPHGHGCAADPPRAQVYNRTSAQTSTLLTNGHTAPVERLRYIDRYLVSGGQDATVKIWAL